MDEIEHALNQNAMFGLDNATADYVLAFAVTASNLRLGSLVIADDVKLVPDS